MEDYKLPIDVARLKIITNALLDHLLEVKGNTVDLSEDYYWEITDDALYNVLQDPTTFTIGQLSDDWETLKKMTADEDDILTYGLVWVSAIFRAIGESVVR